MIKQNESEIPNINFKIEQIIVFNFLYLWNWMLNFDGFSVWKLWYWGMQWNWKLSYFFFSSDSYCLIASQMSLWERLGLAGWNSKDIVQTIFCPSGLHTRATRIKCSFQIPEAVDVVNVCDCFGYLKTAMVALGSVRNKGLSGCPDNQNSRRTTIFKLMVVRWTTTKQKQKHLFFLSFF